jgi:HEAT repeat protein
LAAIDGFDIVRGHLSFPGSSSGLFASYLGLFIPPISVNHVHRAGSNRTALCAALLFVALALPGCAKRFGGMWPFGEDQTAQLKKYGPAPVQRIEAMQARAKKLNKASTPEQEAFAQEMAKQMANEQDINVRLAVIAAMTQMKTPSANAILFAGMKDPETDVRVACAEAWAKRPGSDSTRILAETLSSDTDMDVRIAAAKGLGASSDREAITALGTALEDSDPALQYCAVGSLKQVTGKDLGNDVNAWRRFAQQPDAPVKSKTLAERARQIF